MRENRQGRCSQLSLRVQSACGACPALTELTNENGVGHVPPAHNTRAEGEISLSLFNRNILRESLIPSICLSGAKCFFDTLKPLAGSMCPQAVFCVYERCQRLFSSAYCSRFRQRNSTSRETSTLATAMPRNSQKMLSSATRRTMPSTSPGAAIRSSARK